MKTKKTAKKTAKKITKQKTSEKLEKKLNTQLIKSETAATITNTALKPTILPTDIPEQKSFVAMLNSTATNQFSNISTRSNPPQMDNITGTATIEKGSLKVFIDKYNELTGGLRISTHKLLDACTIELTKQNTYRGPDKEINPTITISLERYMELCGIPQTKPSKDKTRRKVKEDLNTLYHVSMEWTEPSGKITKDFAKMRLCEKIGIIKGKIILSFSKDMAIYLTNSYLMQYSVDLLKVDERNPSSYHIGKKILLHHSISNNIRKGTSNILSVKSLLENCPDIPTYEEVLAKDRALERRIKQPFESALNALPFIKWEYSNSKGAPLSRKQLKATDYHSFINLYIKFEVTGKSSNSIAPESIIEHATKK